MSLLPNRDPNSPVPPRREFFASGLKALIRGIDDAARSVRSVMPGPGRRPRTQSSTAFLRPPGALEEVAFVATCERSGRCITACPVQALQPLRSADPQRSGTPHLIPSQRACVVCDDLSCMKACPSGALTLVPKSEIRIGLAVVDFDRCTRTQGESCEVCVERCPIGSAAIALDAQGRVAVNAAGCVGCGVCELYCPTTPRAITIRPSSAA